MSGTKNHMKKFDEGDNIMRDLMGEDSPFASITMYGTRKDPLFFANDIMDLLEIKNKRDILVNYGTHFVKRKCPMIRPMVRNGKTIYQTRMVSMLTEAGLYRLIGASRSAICNDFWIFIGIVLKKLRLEGVVTLKAAQDEFKKKLKVLTDKTMLQEAVIINNQITLDKTEYLRKMLTEDDESFEYEGDDYQKMAMLLQGVYMKKYYIYLINNKTMEKKPRSSKSKSKKDKIAGLWDETKEIDSTYGVGTYISEFGYLNLSDINEDETYYYYMTDSIAQNKEKYNLMESIFFTNSTEFKNFKATLKEYDCGKNVFKICRSSLKNFAFAFNCKVLKEKVKLQMKKESEKKIAKASKYKYDK